VDGAQTVRGVWVDGAWSTDAATILEAVPVQAVNSSDERGWEGRNGLGEVVWSRPDLLDIRQEGFLSEISDTVTIINGCLEQGEGGCVRGSLFGVDTASGETLWERSGLRGVSAVGDGFALITNDAGDGWEMIDTLTGDLVDESQRWDGIEPFEQQCCGGGAYVWVGRDGGVVFAVNGDRVRVWYPQGHTDTTIDTSLMD
jgi:outer membrane protein assembly factor BamB